MSDIRGSANDQIAALRRELESVRAELLSLRRQRTFSADDAPHVRRAVLTATLSQGGTSTADFYEWDGSAWALVAEDVPVREFTLNTGGDYASGLKGWATWDPGGVWVFNSDECDADDTGLGS